MRTIRRSATVAPFGVGAIYDFGDESLVAMDTYHWNNRGEWLHLHRLERALGVDHFLMAPVVRDRNNPHTSKIPYFRFPQWMFCPSCRKMIRWSYKMERQGEPPKCMQCAKHSKLVPMRFVVGCKGGHLFDLPWWRWAHSKATEPRQKQCQDSDHLKFETHRGSGGGLGSLVVVCDSCHASRSLYGIARKDSLKGVIGNCENRQPWEWADPEQQQQPCTHFPQVMQRGATNLYFPKVQTAIDIPETSIEGVNPLKANIQGHSHYRILTQMFEATATPDTDPGVSLVAKIIADDLLTVPDEVLKVLKGEMKPIIVVPENSIEKLLREEWEAFIQAEPIDDQRASFIAEKADLDSWLMEISYDHPFRMLHSHIDRIVLAKRLREVRVLQGFERQEPGTTMVNPAIDRRLGWLPGIEVFGEGIFLTLNEERLRAWEADNRHTIETRLGSMESSRKRSTLAFLPSFSARFVLIHTLAHILIRQLSFECGYASSSLRERIYSAEPLDGADGMAGVLIYTAEGDSEGSLGGLVREGLPERLFPTLLTALQTARWCSADPICRELEAQGLQGLNRAACHACALVSETSCICSNVMLDRSILIGDDAGMPGFFDSVCRAMDDFSSKEMIQ
ncbi:MAG: DUF1998 domain-containing protein [Bacteroidia bacterium]|nr:DUF1998 domain-containing protein [Bacteroidia bacterium]